MNIVEFTTRTNTQCSGGDAGVTRQRFDATGFAPETGEGFAALRAIANSIYGPELVAWRFIDEERQLGSVGINCVRTNPMDSPTCAHPFSHVAYKLKDGSPDLGNYLAFRHYN